MASKCRKFVPNIFNKTKCQTCFGSKEQHSAEALESNKASRKMSKCGYLFVAPDYDFNNPLDKTRRWQRRFFVLYDDGELAYSVDENPDTVPQGVVDMNKCTDVKDASGSTSHSNSMAIITPEKTTYIKAGSKEEILWWNNILVKFVENSSQPEKSWRSFNQDLDNKENIDTNIIDLDSDKTHKKIDIYIGDNSSTSDLDVGDDDDDGDDFGSVDLYLTGELDIEDVDEGDDIDYEDVEIEEEEDFYPSASSTATATGDGNADTKGRFEVEKVKSKDQAFSTYRGVRNMKHNKTDRHHQEGLRKSSSLHDLSSEEKEMGTLKDSRFLSRSGDRLNSTDGTVMYSDNARLLTDYNNPYATLPRTTGKNWQAALVTKPLQPSNQQDKSSSASLGTASNASSSSTSDSASAPRRGSFDDKALPTSKSRNASERARLHRERSASMKTFPTQLSLPKIPSSVGVAGVDRLLTRGDSTSSQSSTGHPNENETDEHKMAKSSEMQAATSRATPPPPSPTRAGAAGVTAAGTKFEGVKGVHQSRAPKRDQDLMYMKKGWLIKMGTSEKDWKKHWFVLTGNSLRYYQDAKAEETNSLDGRIDLSSCYDISEVQIPRNYGFKIKTRNGEYILSAMTSGIRSNWMKAIRLCMDLQAGAKTSSNTNLSTDTSTPTASARTIDDMELESPSAATRLAAPQDASRPTDKKDLSKNVRRHYSDVNPGNISKLLSVRNLGTGGDNSRSMLQQTAPSSSSTATSSASISLTSAKDVAPIERESRLEVKSVPASHTEPSQTPAQKPATKLPEQFWGGSGLPFRRFVEGSDSHVVSGQPSENTALSKPSSSSDSKREEEERKKRAKSPSARIKERSRAKSPKLHSPPPEQEDQFNFRMSIPGTETRGEDRVSISSEEMDVIDAGDHEHGYLEGDDNLGSTMSSAGETMLVELLESEVESLKERLEHTQQELCKSHDSNRDLKTKLQTVVREKDSSSQLQASIDSSYSNHGALVQQSHSPDSQAQAMKRQLKDNKDTIQRQKMEVDNLKSKLDMSVSKLTGTEKALSEALKEVKQEKDKYLKINSEFNRKIRTLESQLKESTAKTDHCRENLLIKEKENRKMENEMKVVQQNLRDHEREILKLKAIEHEYRQMKEKFDDTDRLVARLRREINDKDVEFKKLETEYEQQFDSVMQEVAKDRDNAEQHIEKLKKDLESAQRKTTMSDSITSTMADSLREKDEIIAQLEEKMIENEGKMVDMTEELQAEVEENAELQQTQELLQEERDNAVAKVKDLEKVLSQYQAQLTRLEKDGAASRKLMDDLRKENTDLNDKLQSEKTDTVALTEDNEELKQQVQKLEEEMHGLERQLSAGGVRGRDKLSVSSDGSGSMELLHSFILATAEMNDVTDCVLGMRQQFESILSQHSGEQKPQLTSMAETLEDLGRKCESISEVLKEGSSLPSPPPADSTKQSKEEVSALEKELESLKSKNKQAEADGKKLSKELAESKARCSKLQTEDTALKAKVKTLDEKYQTKVGALSARVDDLASKSKVKTDKTDKKEKKKGVKLDDSTDTVVLSEEIESQLLELEGQIGVVERVLQTQDLSTATDSQQEDTATDEDELEDSEDSDEDYTDSEEDSEEESDEEEDARNESNATDASESILGKLKEMKSQLELTNNRIKDLTVDISDQSMTSGMEADVGAEGELRKTLIKCGEKIDTLTNRLSDGMKTARTELPKFSDNTWAFQKCVNHLKSKLAEVNVLTVEHGEVNAKDLKVIQEKLRHLLQFVEQVDRLGESDWEVAGKIAKQEMKFQHLLAHKEKAAKRSQMKYEDKLQLYADKLAFEAMILGQMAILIQRQQVGSVYKDVLLKEIHEANLQILELERRIDNTSREMNPTDQEKDLVSSYAAMLAEKIVLEGQLASCVMVQDLDNSENKEVLTSLQVTESPAVLATEIFLRSQLDSSVSQQLQKFAENMDAFSNHIVTKALLQGEVTHALQLVKRKFDCTNKAEDLPKLMRRERQFAYDQLSVRHKTILDVVNEQEPFIMTTLIQLIEYDHGPNAPTLDSVCASITDIVMKEVAEQKKQMETADTHMKAKMEYIISHLETELEDAVLIFREEYQCYVQTASPDIDPNILRFSAASVSADLAGIFIQKAIIDGTFAFVSDLHMSSPDVPASQMMEPPEEQDSEQLSDLAKSLGQILLTEAANKQQLAADVRFRSSDKDGASSITDLIGVIPDLEAYPQTFNAYAATLVREAMFQSQLTYTTYKLKLQYHRQLRDIQLKIDTGQKVELPSDLSRDAQSDIQASLTIFEEILETKYQDECAVLSLLDSEMSKFKDVASDKSCSRCKVFESQLRSLEKTFQHEVSVGQERQNVHLDVLRQEVNNVVLRVDKFLEQHEKDKEAMITDYEDRIVTLQDEFDIMRIDHEDELEQVKQDIMTAVSAIRANEEDGESGSTDQVRTHNKLLVQQLAACKELLGELRENPGPSARQGELLQKIEAELTKLEEIETDPNISQEINLPVFSSSETVPVTTPPAVSPEPPPLERSISKEVEKVEEGVEKVLERSQHEHELELLKKEKEEALAEEIKTTKAALDAMRKAYEDDLEQEKEKYRHALKTMCTDDYVEEIRRRYDKELERLAEELRTVTMHYDGKEEDYKVLEDRLERTKAEYQTHINQLQKSNSHLTETVNQEIEQLKEFIQTRTTGTLTGSATLEEELYDAQIMVRVKDAELQKLRSQVKNTENNLERATEEQRYTMTQYLTMVKKSQELESKLKQAITLQKERKDSTHEEQLGKEARALRRTPSFHQRARSPSPDTISPRRDSTEHHSRDSHRRRQLGSKDLKRSKSSPSLPYVFEAKGLPGHGNQSSGLPGSSGRRDSSSKYSKSPRKS